MSHPWRIVCIDDRTDSTLQLVMVSDYKLSAKTILVPPPNDTPRKYLRMPSYPNRMQGLFRWESMHYSAATAIHVDADIMTYNTHNSRPSRPTVAFHKEYSGICYGNPTAYKFMLRANSYRRRHYQQPDIGASPPTPQQSIRFTTALIIGAG